MLTSVPETTVALDTADDDAARLDGSLSNIFTGLGIPGKDKRLGNRINVVGFLSYMELEALYRNGLIRRYVDAIPEAILRHRTTIKLSTETAPQDIVVKFDKYLQETRFHQLLREVIALQRLYGGAGMVLLINDGQPPEAPVDTARIRSIEGFAPLSRHELIPEDLTSSDWSKPDFYRITTTAKLSQEQQEPYLNMRIHHSRVARFDGLYLPRHTRQANMGWGDSVIQVIWEAWQDYVSALGGLSNLIGEGDLLVHQIPGLMQRIAAGGEDAIRKRLELNNISRSVYGTFVLDKEESLSNLSRNLSNMSSATEPFTRYMQAVTGWPAAILMGDSPGGLGLGAERRPEERVWAALVEAWQMNYCQDPVTQIFSLILASKDGPTRGQIPAGWEVLFPTVYTTTEAETADLQVKISQADNTYIQLGVLNPLEVRQARFGSTEFSIETALLDGVTDQMVATTEAQFEAQLAGIEAQRTAATGPALPDEAPPEGVTAEEALAAEQQALQDSADLPYSHYSVQGLRIRVLKSLDGVEVGHLVGPDGQRLDASAAAPLMVFGPHRTKNYRLYRARFASRLDDELLDGPYVTGFASLRAARQAVMALFPKQSLAGLSALPESEISALRAGWDTY